MIVFHSLCGRQMGYKCTELFISSALFGPASRAWRVSYLICGPSSVAKTNLFHMSKFTLKILSSVFVMGWNHCHAKLRSIILGNRELLENVRPESGGSSNHQEQEPGVEAIVLSKRREGKDFSYFSPTSLLCSLHIILLNRTHILCSKNLSQRHSHPGILEQDHRIDFCKETSIWDKKNIQRSNN